MDTGLTAAWQGMRAVTGDRTMPKLKKAFGQYNAYEDPKFYQDLQMFEQNPTAQRADMMLKEYGDTLDAEDQQAFLSKITPMEGTPQYYDWQNAETQYNLNQNQLKQSNIQTEAMPELTDIELGLQRNNLQQSNIQTEGMQEYYMPTKALEFQMLGDQADMTATEAENFGEMQDLQMEAQELQNYSQQLANEYREETDPIKKQMLEQKWEMAQDSYDARLEQIIANSNITQDQAKVSGNTVQYRIDKAGAQARQSVTQANILEEQAPALMKQPGLQNTGTNLNNQLKANEVWQSNREKEMMEEVYNDQGLEGLYNYLYADETGGEGIDANRTAGTTADGRTIYNAIGGSKVVTDPQTGNLRQATPDELEQAGFTMVNPFQIMYDRPELRTTIGENNILELSKMYPDKMTIEEANSFIKTYVPDFDISNIIRNQSLGDRVRPEQSWSEFSSQVSPEPEPEDNEIQPKYQLNTVVQGLKNQIGVQTNYELNQALNQISPEMQQKIENTYGYTITDIISNLTTGQ